MTIGILGSGSVAAAMCRALSADHIVLWARDAERGAVLAAECGAEFEPELAALTQAASLILCVRDDAIAEVASRLAEELGTPPSGAAVFHTSGFHSADVLAPLAARGWQTGSLHPLISMPPGVRAELKGGWFAIDGTPAARGRATELISVVGGHVLKLSTDVDARQRYHAAAALVANGLVALLDAALETLGDAAPEAEARAAFAELAQGVFRNVTEHGTAASLTGPAARGEAELVAGHLALLGPESRAIYVALTRRMLQLAEERGTLGAQARRAIEGALG